MASTADAQQTPQPEEAGELATRLAILEAEITFLENTAPPEDDGWEVVPLALGETRPEKIARLRAEVEDLRAQIA